MIAVHQVSAACRAIELINAKRSGKTIGPQPRPKGDNAVDLMGCSASTRRKKPRKVRPSLTDQVDT
jgi:hypothetical protein